MPKPGTDSFKRKMSSQAFEKFGEARRMWTAGTRWEIILWRSGEGDDSELNIEDKGEAQGFPVYKIILKFPGTSRRMTLNLTWMTTAELDALEEFMRRAINRARPIVTELDRLAQEAYANGDDSFIRIYRPVPRLLDRDGPEWVNGSSIPVRPLDRNGGGGYLSGKRSELDAGPSADAVAELEPGAVGSDDLQPSSLGSEGVGEAPQDPGVGGVPDADAGSS